MRKEPREYQQVTIDFDGKSYSATYFVSSKVVTVNTLYGKSSTQVGGSPAESIARRLFREILEGARSRGEIWPFSDRAPPQ